MTTHRLEIIELSCARGDRTLFEGLRLEVGDSELLHIAGSNGSGKTTLLRTVCALSRPAAGEIRWQGKSVRTLGDEYRRHLAYVGHHDGVQGELTPAENLRAYLCLFGGSTSANGVVQDVLERLGLAPYRSFTAKVLSQGQRRRLALARLLVTDKPIWVLDEPFTALDLRSCRLVSELLAQHLTRGGVVVMSSHQDFEIPGIIRNRIDLDSLRTDGPPMPETYSARQASAGQRPA